MCPEEWPKSIDSQCRDCSGLCKDGRSRFLPSSYPMNFSQSNKVGRLLHPSRRLKQCGFEPRSQSSKQYHRCNRGFNRCQYHKRLGRAGRFLTSCCFDLLQCHTRQPCRLCTWVAQCKPRLGCSFCKLPWPSTTDHSCDLWPGKWNKSRR
jgi:hypothetical protein